MKFITILTVTAGFLSGCMFTDIQQYARIDRDNKTIAMFPDSVGAYTQLGTILRSNGFEVFIKNKAKDAGSDIIKTRYELFANFRTRDICFIGGSQYDYVISIADLETGQEVFTMSGVECQRTIEKKFRKFLHDELADE